MSLLGSKVFPAPADKRERDLFYLIDDMLGQIRRILNGGIVFSDNFDAKMVSFTSSATPDAENTVAHGLSKVPTGYIVYGLDKAAIVYSGTTSWTSTNIYLKCNVASTTIKLLVF